MRASLSTPAPGWSPPDGADPRSEQWPVALLFVHGPGGVGKSVLLRQFSRAASAAKLRTLPGATAWRGAVLDKILVDAAVAAGAELRDGVAVESLVTDGDRVLGVCTSESAAPITARRMPPGSFWRGTTASPLSLRVDVRSSSKPHERFIRASSFTPYAGRRLRLYETGQALGGSGRRSG